MRASVATEEQAASPQPGGGASQPGNVPVTIRVVDLKAKPVEGARVVVTSGEVFGPLDSQDMAPQLESVDVALDKVTGETGSVRFDAVPSSRYFVRVAGRKGRPGAGRRWIELPPGKPAEFTYVVGRIHAGAVLLSDGASPLHVDWAIDASYQITPKGVRAVRKELAARLGLASSQVTALVPAEALERVEVSVAVCHPRIGWFRTTAAVVPVEELRSPTLIEVPATGENRPVQVIVKCVNPAGDPVDTRVRLMGGRYAPGSQLGWPRFGLSFPSNEPQLFPPGRLDVAFVDASLTAVGMKTVQVTEDTTIEMKVPFTPHKLALRLQIDGTPHRGRTAVRVTVPSLKRTFVTRSLGNPTGVMTLSVPRELKCDLYLAAGERSAAVHLDPDQSPVPAETFVVLQ